jgi:type IV pilus assembly protein PilV
MEASTMTMTKGIRFLRKAQSGFTMMEVLVSMLIIMLGLLGLVGMLARMQQSEFESYQRSQALVLLQDMVDRLNVHRATATCFRLTDPTTGAPTLGTGSAGAPACSASTANDNAEATASMTEWDSLLKGAGETSGGSSVGAMIGARGCISYDSTTELLDPTGVVIAGTGVYTVSVAWQGNSDTFAPVVNCGNGQYGTTTRRRLVFMTFRIAKLT